MSQQAMIGTTIAILGTWLYTEAAKRFGTAKKVDPPPKAA